MERAVKLVATNLGLTVAVITVCLIGASLLAAVLGSIQYPETRQKGTYTTEVIPGNKAKRAAVMDSWQTFGMWTGLVVSQAVFVVMHLERPPARVSVEPTAKTSEGS